MNMEKYPQFQLYLMTLHFQEIKRKLIPENCDEWCVNATIVNRAYYSSYLYCALWLEYIKGFKVRKPWEFNNENEGISEHKQVRDALYDFGKANIKTELQELASLRKHADYEPFRDILPHEVLNAINHMEKIFSNLRFE